MSSVFVECKQWPQYCRRQFEAEPFMLLAAALAVGVMMTASYLRGWRGIALVFSLLMTVHTLSHSRSYDTVTEQA
jgi:hypothetical protein